MIKVVLIVFKDSIRIPIISLIASVIWQVIAQQEINWFDTLGICVTMFVVILFHNLVKETSD